jgi:hypothetical protein
MQSIMRSGSPSNSEPSDSEPSDSEPVGIPTRRKHYEISQMEMVGSSTSALVLKIDDSRVLKVNLQPEMTKTKRKAYRLFETVGESPHILKCIDYGHSQGLIFERLDSRSIAKRLLEERFPCAITIL